MSSDENHDVVFYEKYDENIKCLLEIMKNINGCGIRSRVEDNHAYSEGRRRSPEEYGGIIM